MYINTYYDGLGQCFPNFFARWPLQDSQNDHGSLHLGTSKQSVRTIGIKKTNLRLITDFR